MFCGERKYMQVGSLVGNISQCEQVSHDRAPPLCGRGEDDMRNCTGQAGRAPGGRDSLVSIVVVASGIIYAGPNFICSWCSNGPVEIPEHLC